MLNEPPSPQHRSASAISTKRIPSQRLEDLPRLGADVLMPREVARVVPGDGLAAEPGLDRQPVEVGGEDVDDERVEVLDFRREPLEAFLFLRRLGQVGRILTAARNCTWRSR